MIVLDANYILRYLLDDNHEMFLEAKNIIDTQVSLILNEVLAEVIYVLEDVYAVSRELVSQTLSDFIVLENMQMLESKEFFLLAMKLYKHNRLDYVDCYLCSLKNQYEVKTFDKKLLKCLS